VLLPRLHHPLTFLTNHTPQYKTAFYTYYLPIAIGVIIDGIVDEKVFDLAKVICCTMSEYFQIQDDYLDCYGNEKQIGKVGTDIENNKCSWMVVQALNMANEKQRKTLEQNYGKWDEKKVKVVKDVYEELDTSKMFSVYEEQSFVNIQDTLDKVTMMPKEVFSLLFKKVYKRQK